MFRMKGVLLTAFATVLKISSGQLHFASIGNWGSGSSVQNSVGASLKTKAKEAGISLVISPGSNFPGGVSAIDDKKWDFAFRQPFEGKDLNLPFFTVLGSEDWSGNYTAQALQSGVVSINNNGHPRWTMPNWWYHYSMHFADATDAGAAYTSSDGSIGYIFIDTHLLSDQYHFQNITTLQWNQIKASIEGASKIFDWVVVVGDKAILSSGASKGDLYLADTLRPLLKSYKVDAYISGNDYDMEVIEDGTLLHINCGTGSGADPLVRVKAENSMFYAAKPGFCHHVVTKKEFFTEFIDGYSGNVIGNFTKTRNTRERTLFDRFQVHQALPEIQFIDIPEFAEVQPADSEDLFVKFCGSLGIVVVIGILMMSGIITVNRALKVAVA